MYVCICKQITDQDIKKAVIDGVRSMPVLRSTLPIGKNCGKCYQCACQMLRECVALHSISPDNSN